MRSIFIFLFIISFLKTPALYANNTEEQVVLQETLSEKEKRKFDYFFLEALRLKQNEKYSEAFNTFKYCIGIDSTSSSTYYELSNFYLFLNKKDMALDALQKAVKYEGGRFEYKVALANLSRDLGHIAEASTIYEELVKENPDKPELNYFLSDLYVRQGEIEKAIAALNILESNLGKNESLSIQKFRLYSLLGKNEEAFEEIEELARKYPYEPQYQILIGDLYLDRKDTGKAYNYYQKANELDPGNPYYIVSMANYYELTGNTEAAEQEIDTALRNPKLDIETKLTVLGRYIQNLQKNNKEIENANTLFLTLTEQHPQEMELNVMYGTFLAAQDKLDEAKYRFSIVTESSPDNIEAWEQLLRIAFRQDNPGEAIEICKKALEYFPDATVFHFYMGIAYHQKEEYSEALQAYQEGIKHVEPENVKLLSDFYGQIGDVYHQLNEKEKAYENYEKALEYNDKNIGVLNNYAYFLSLEGKDLSKAERMSSITVKMFPDNSTYIDTYAWIFYMQGNYTLAKFYIESALSKGGDENEEILNHYGDILYKTGEIDKAVEQWQKALELDSDNESLKRKIAERKLYESENEKE